MRLRRAWAFVRRLLSSRRAERDLDADVQSYADLLADDYVAAGVGQDEARRRARIALGGVEPVKEAVREVRAGVVLEQIWRDVTYAVRGFRRSPGFAATAAITIALGVGVNTTIFSIIDSTLFKPLPYERPDELVRIGHRVRQGTPMVTTQIGMSWVEMDAWRAESDLVQAAESARGGKSLQWRERGEPLITGAVTPGMPAMLGIKPILGRMFTAEEVASGTPLIVISESLWSTAFGRQPNAIGQTMTIDGHALTVVGVLPKTFRFGPGGGGVALAWTALSSRPDPANPSSITSPIFRLRTGLSRDAATALASRVAARIQQSKPEPEPWTPELMRFFDVTTRSQSSLRSPMLMLMGTAGLVLLVACVNVANLLLVRGAGREQEIAMRTALGASRSRIARLLLIEGAAVAIIGGVAGLLVAKWTPDVIVALMPARMRNGMFQVSAPVLDARVMLFAFGTTVIVALLAAVWPAISGSRTALRVAIGGGQQVAGRRRGRSASGALQAVQVALAFLLAMTAGLFATSFARMLTTDLGFDANGLSALTVQLPEYRYRSDQAMHRAAGDLLARIRATPGVRQAAVGPPPPATMAGRMVRTGATQSSGDLAIRVVGDRYFETAGIRLMAGRDFAADDTRQSPHVAIIDEAGARVAFGDESPIGQRFTYSPYVPELTIVGVAATVAASDFVDRPNRIGMYLAASQDEAYTSFVVRTDGDPGVVRAGLKETVAAFDPLARVTTSGAATDYYESMETYAAPRFYVVLVSVFAVLALVTASVGLYGLLSYSVASRRREIGVRVALGSTPARIRRLLLGEAARPIVIGLAAGGLTAWWVTKALATLLYGITPRDPRAFAIGALALVATSLIAAIAPIRRATGVDPIIALRAE